MEKSKFTIMEEITRDAKVVKEENMNAEKRYLESEVVNENFSDDYKLMRDNKGNTYIRRKIPTAMDTLGLDVYGCAVKCEGELNEENVQKAKEIVLENMFEIIKGIAKTIPDDFFVIKDKETWKDAYRHPPVAANKIPDEEIEAINYFTVGCRLCLPNVYKEKLEQNDRD